MLHLDRKSQKQNLSFPLLKMAMIDCLLYGGAKTGYNLFSINYVHSKLSIRLIKHWLSIVGITDFCGRKQANLCQSA